jgi:hypothetical protein
MIFGGSRPFNFDAPAGRPGRYMFKKQLLHIYNGLGLGLGLCF